MKTKKLRKSIIFTSLLLLLIAARAVEDHVDYSNLTQTISILKLRAGNHDKSGNNTYYFTVKANGIVVTKEERKKPFAERQKHTIELGQIGEIKITALSFLDTGEAAATSSELSGEQLRELVSQTMAKFKVSESQVGVILTVTMFEKEKILGLIGDDIKVGEASYYPIPETLPRRPNRKNLELEITDDKGTLVHLTVKYQKQPRRGNN